MNHSDDNEIDVLLRKQLEGPVPDNGFSDCVMQRLPQRRRRVVWPLWVGILAGTGAYWLSLLSTPLLQVGWRDWFRGELSASAISLMAVAAGMSLLACCWTMMEAEDH